jgi:hypothetical protein
VEAAKRLVREVGERKPGLAGDAACQRSNPQLEILPDMPSKSVKDTSNEFGLE